MTYYSVTSIIPHGGGLVIGISSLGAFPEGHGQNLGVKTGRCEEIQMILFGSREAFTYVLTIIYYLK